MRDVAVDFLQRVRSIIEAAERGLVREDDLAAGRQSMNELLEQDWVMPRAVSEVSIQWRLIEDSLRTIREGQAGVQSPAEELQAAWTAYREIEEVLQSPQ
jgi:hypothetical protein